MESVPWARRQACHRRADNANLFRTEPAGQPHRAIDRFLAKLADSQSWRKMRWFWGASDQGGDDPL